MRLSCTYIEVEQVSLPEHAEIEGTNGQEPRQAVSMHLKTLGII